MSAATRLGFKAIPDPHIPPQLKQEVGNVVMDIIRNYKVNASSSREESLQEAWDYVQAQVRRAGGDTWAVHIRSLMSAQRGCVVVLPVGTEHKCSCPLPPPSTASETAPGSRLKRGDNLEFSSSVHAWSAPFWLPQI